MATTRGRFASACRRGGHLHRQWWWPGRLARSNGETTPSPPLSLSPPLAVGMALVAAVSSTLAAAGAAPPLGNAPSHGGFVAMLTSRAFTSCFRLALPACTRLYPLTHPPLPLPPPHAFPHLTAWCGALAPFPSLPSNRVVPASDVLLVRCSHTSPPPPTPELCGSRPPARRGRSRRRHGRARSAPTAASRPATPPRPRWRWTRGSGAVQPTNSHAISAVPRRRRASSVAIVSG